MFGHAMKYKECPMRNRGYNCDPVGGDCATGISDELCEAIHAAYNKGSIDGADQMLKIVLKKILEYEKRFNQVDDFEVTDAIGWLYEEIRQICVKG